MGPFQALRNVEIPSVDRLAVRPLAAEGDGGGVRPEGSPERLLVALPEWLSDRVLRASEHVLSSEER